MSDVKRWTPCLHNMWLATETDPALLDMSKLYVLASDYDVLLQRLAEVERLLDEAGEHIQHTPGHCWIALGEIRECNCGADEFDTRRKAALSQEASHG